MAKKVILGLSGGVDSSVSAHLLKEAGYDVEAVFMKNWEEDDTDTYCPAEQDIADAQSVCTRLGIPLHTVNFSEDYLQKVFSYFLTEYKTGRTPNPDILCNKEIKFKAFFEYALNLGADYIATGHYAQIRKIKQEKEEETNNKESTYRYELVKGNDNNKDQTYFLYTLQQKHLAKVLFPIGHLPKQKVREIALENNLVTHDKKDSTGICFIGERKFKDFLSTYLPAQQGDIITEDGTIIGKHDGLMYYTIGQRQGLNIGGVKGGKQTPWYVASKDIKTNTLTVVQGDDNPLLYKQSLTAKDLSWVDRNLIQKLKEGSNQEKNSFKCKAKIRYRQPEQPCTVNITHSKELNEDIAQVVFDEPQKAITEGQAIVFYLDDVCLGGGTIISSSR